MKLDKTVVLASAILAMSVIPALSAVYNYFSPGGALSGSATVQTVNLGSGAYIAGNLPVGNLDGGVNASATTVWCGIGHWCLPPSATTAYANPSAVIGLTAVNGTASTAMRSDSAPPLNQGILPTWSALHTFNGKVLVNGFSGAPSMTVNGAANEPGEKINGSATSGQSFGELIAAGTTSADYGLRVTNQSGSANYLTVFGDGGITTNGQTDKGAGIINAGGVDVGGIPLPQTKQAASTFFTYQSFTTSSSACSGSSQESNIGACSRLSAGQYQVSFFTAYNSAPVCFANSPEFIYVFFTAIPSTSAVVVQDWVSTTGATRDGDAFSIICIGN